MLRELGKQLRFLRKCLRYRMPLRIALLVVFAWLLAPAQETPVIDAVHKGHAVGHEQDGVNAIQMRSALVAT